MANTEVLKKFKRLKPIEQPPPPLGILRFFFLALFLFLFCFVYLGYKVLGRGFKLNEQLQSQTHWFRVNNNKLDKDERVGFLDVGGESCDLFKGNWVWDEAYPLYQEKDCLFLDQGFQCTANGRPDSFYTMWRWQPQNCNLPRFDARLMLEKLRNRRLVFVGDSIGRNQWESLLCMLSSAIPNKDSIYEVNGSPITKHMGFLSFMFSEFNCTIEYYRAPFLVLQSRAPVGVPQEVKTTVKVDQMDWSSVQWRDADILIFNTGHWWNHEKTTKGGSYFQEGQEVKMNMSVDRAYQRSIETLGDWIRMEVNKSKTQVFYRTYAPVHFRDGDWNTGGSCHTETLPDLDSTFVPFGASRQLTLFHNAISGLNKSHVIKIDVLNVTQLSSQRKDGHASLYYLGPKTGPAPHHRQDCSHWCLPGVPDTWNELLYALFLKREATLSKGLMAS